MAAHSQPTSNGNGVLGNNAMTISDESKERVDMNALSCRQLSLPQNAKTRSSKRRKNQAMSSLANVELLSTLQLEKCLRSSSGKHEL